MKLSNVKVTENTNVWIPLLKPFAIRMFNNALFLACAVLFGCLTSGCWKFIAVPFVILVISDLIFYFMGVARRKREKKALLEADEKK